jgi:uncharacterized protein (TIGR02391 family)
VDHDEAISVLNEHKRLIAECGRTTWLTKDRKAALDRLNEHSPAVNAILRHFNLGGIGGTTLGWHRQAQRTIDRALALLAAGRSMVQAATCLGHPALPMGVLHPAVYNVARPLWDKGNYRHAVADAATNVSHFAQRRLRRYDVSDRELMAQAFSDKEPERGKARLRCPGKRNSETVKSLQEGAKLFAMGTFHAVRNPAHHSIGDGEPVAAFEDLVALSKVARWVEDWYVDEYLEPIDVTQLAPAPGRESRKSNVSASLSGKFLMRLCFPVSSATCN